MSWFKRILSILFLIAFVLILFFAYRHFRQNTREGGGPMRAVPSSAGLVLRTQDPEGLWDKLGETNIIWENLVSKGPLASIDTALIGLDSLLAGEERLKPLLEGKGTVISLHSVGSRSAALQFSFGIPGNVAPERVLEGLKGSLGSVRERQYEGVTIYEFGDVNEASLAYAEMSRVLILSASPILVENAVRHMKDGKGITRKEGFQQVMRTSGSDVDANLFLNYPPAERILSKFLRPSISEILKEEGDWARWAGLDLLLRPRSLLLTGFTLPGEGESSYLATLRGQEPRTVKIPNVLPERTAYFHALGVSDMNSYLEHYQNYLEGTNRNFDREEYLERLSDSCNCEPVKKATRWIGHEMASAYIEPEEDGTPQKNALIAIRTFDRKAAQRSLKALGKRGSDSIRADENLAGHEGIALYRLPTDGLYQTLLGDAFPDLEKPYFILFQGHVILSEEKAVLREILRDHELGRSLGNDVDYDSFTDGLSQRSNLLIYSNIGRSPHLLSKAVRPAFAEKVLGHIDLIRKFQAFGLQFSARPNGQLYSNVHLEYDPVYKKETGSLWEAALDTGIRSQPHLVRNHYTDALEVFVQDLSDRVQLISNTGEVLWKKQLEGPIMSKVRQIDVYKNGKLQILFNTEQKVHLLDRKGRYVDGFPIELPEPATAPMALFDYANDKRYRILVPCADKKIHYYDKHGKELDGWGFEGTETSMLRPPQHIRIDKKDYVLVTDSAGEVLLLDRRGNVRYEVEERIGPSKHTPLVVSEGKSIGASSIAYTDTGGAVVKFRFKGQKSRTHFKEGMEEPYFFEQKDLESDGKKEYILVEGQELMVYGADEEQRFGYTFDSTITTPPLVQHVPEEMSKVGVLDKKNAEAYLFDRSGSLHDGFPLFGSTPFSIGDMNRDGYQELVIGSEDGTLYCYSLN